MSCTVNNKIQQNPSKKLQTHICHRDTCDRSSTGVVIEGPGFLAFVLRHHTGSPYFFLADGSTYPHPSGVHDMSVAQ